MQKKIQKKTTLLVGCFSLFLFHLYMDTDPSITRCVCAHNEIQDVHMVQCDKCAVWQHSWCMGLDEKNMPESYFCEVCVPREVSKRVWDWGGE